MGNHVTATIVAAQGHLELNVSSGPYSEAAAITRNSHRFSYKFRPSHGGQSGIYRDMLVTSLNPLIGYDKAVKIGKLALAET
jgi:fumarate hydratase, class II